MYRYDEFDAAFVSARVAQFRDQVARRLSGELTEEQVRRFLGYGTRMQVHGFLKEHDVYLKYSPEDLEQDMQTLRHLREREPARG